MSAPEIVRNSEESREGQGVAAHALLGDARRLLRAALPPAAAGEDAPLASVMHLHAEPAEVLAALHVYAQLPLPAASRRPKREPVTVEVASHWLSVAGVVTLLEDGAVRAADRPLQAGPYWCATVNTGGERVARFWFPEVAAKTHG